MSSHTLLTHYTAAKIIIIKKTLHYYTTLQVVIFASLPVCVCELMCQCASRCFCRWIRPLNTPPTHRTPSRPPRLKYALFFAKYSLLVSFVRGPLHQNVGPLPSVARHVLGSGFVCQFSSRAKTSIQSTLPLRSIPLNGGAAHPQGHCSVSGELGHLPWLMHGIFGCSSVCVQRFISVLTTAPAHHYWLFFIFFV